MAPISSDVPQFPPLWREFVERHVEDAEAFKTALRAVVERVDAREREGAEIFPMKAERFRAFDLVAPEAARVVLLGQDPYFGVVTTHDGRQRPQAHGLAFSIERDCALPASLKRLLNERRADLGTAIPPHGDLSAWAAQGVLMMNTVLTVEKGRANSHQGYGWQAVTGAVLEAISRRGKGVVFIFLGGKAQAMGKRVAATNIHHVVALDHPVARRTGSASLKGSRLFSRVNAVLQDWGSAPVKW